MYEEKLMYTQVLLVADWEKDPCLCNQCLVRVAVCFWQAHECNSAQHESCPSLPETIAYCSAQIALRSLQSCVCLITDAHFKL